VAHGAASLQTIPPKTRKPDTLKNASSFTQP
jgi:hypothetical protein